jgi:hypothetical protein
VTTSEYLLLYVFDFFFALLRSYSFAFGTGPHTSRIAEQLTDTAKMIQ